MICAASIPLPAGRFGRCSTEATEMYRSFPLCEPHLKMAKQVEARQSPAWPVFQSIMEQPDLEDVDRCQGCLGPKRICRCTRPAVPDEVGC